MPAKVTPQHLFPVVEKLESIRLPEMITCGHDRTSFAHELNVKSDVGTKFCVGTGRQLATQAQTILEEIRSELLVFDDSTVWDDLVSVMAAIIRDFFRLLPSCPAVLTGHVLTWTDRYVARANSAQMDHEALPHYPTFDGQTPVPLRFDDAPPRCIALEPLSLDNFWLMPPGVDKADTELLKVAHHVSIRRNGRSISAPRAEYLGLGIPDSMDHGLLAQGIHPARAQSLYAVWRDPGSGRDTLRPVNTPLRKSREDHSLPCVDPAGVLDLYTVKAQRLMLDRVLPGEDIVTFDELAFSLDRKQGQIASIVASSDILTNGYLGQPFEQYALGQWLAARL